jgi:hypothetical protein
LHVSHVDVNAEFVEVKRGADGSQPSFHSRTARDESDVVKQSFQSEGAAHQINPNDLETALFQQLTERGDGEEIDMAVAVAEAAFAAAK